MLSWMFGKLNSSVARVAPWLAGAALMVTAGTASAQPTVEIVVHDGQGMVIAGCSQPDYCMGNRWMTTQLTGTITQSKNYVDWMYDNGKMPISLWVDGKLVLTQSRNKVIIWSIGRLPAGDHTLVATVSDAAGNVGSSAPLTLTIVK